MEELNKFLDEVDTPVEAMNQSKKRQFLRDLVEKGQALCIPGKTPWTVKRLDEASDRVINKLHKKIQNDVAQTSNKDLMSRVAGVDDVQAMMKDINSNYLIRNQATEMIGKLTPKISVSSNTPMEILGSHVYEKCGMYLAPVSLFCTVFNHLDWQNFARIVEERKEAEAEPEESIE